MNFRPQKSEEVDVNLTPLIDVVFLLLIFFMVSTTFQDQSEIDIRLPTASEEPKVLKADSIDITINAEGQFFVNSRPLVNAQLATLKRAIKEIAGDEKDPLIIVKADAMTPHQAVIMAMDASRQLGFGRLGFATIQDEK